MGAFLTKKNEMTFCAGQ